MATEITISGLLHAAQWMTEDRDKAEASPNLATARLDSEAAEAVYQEPGRFIEIYERHHEAIFRYLARRTGNRDLALDLTSQAFAKALEFLRRQQVQNLQVKSWLYQIATRVHLQHERTYRRWLNRIPLMGIYLERRALENSNPAYVNSDLLALLARLPEKYRTPVILRYFEGLSYLEIALAIGEKESTTRSQVHRGLERLRQMLESSDAH